MCRGLCWKCDNSEGIEVISDGPCNTLSKVKCIAVLGIVILEHTESCIKFIEEEYYVKKRRQAEGKI